MPMLAPTSTNVPKTGNASKILSLTLYSYVGFSLFGLLIT